MMSYKLTALLKICGSFVRLSIYPPARIELLGTVIEKFEEIKNVDYSALPAISIGTRDRQCLIVNYDDVAFIVNHRYGSPSDVRRVLTWNDSIIIMPYPDWRNLEKALDAFGDLSVTTMSIDENANVYLRLYWNDQCIYDFIRVLPGHSLDDVKARFHRNEDYVLYEDNWYVHKECKECRRR